MSLFNKINEIQMSLMKDMESLRGEVRKFYAAKKGLEFKRKIAESFTEDISIPRKKLQDCEDDLVETMNNSVVSHETEVQAVISDQELLESFDEEMGTQ